jgi:hypothetical protein
MAVIKDLHKELTVKHSFEVKELSKPQKIEASVNVRKFYYVS